MKNVFCNEIPFDSTVSSECLLLGLVLRFFSILSMHVDILDGRSLICQLLLKQTFWAVLIPQAHVMYIEESEKRKKKLVFSDSNKASERDLLHSYLSLLYLCI